MSLDPAMAACVSDSCRRALPPGSNVCPYCGLSQVGPVAPEAANLTALLEVVHLMEVATDSSGQVQKWAQRLSIDTKNLALDQLRPGDLPRLIDGIASQDVRESLLEVLYQSTYSDGVMTKPEAEFLDEVVGLSRIDLDTRSNIEKTYGQTPRLSRLLVATRPADHALTVDPPAARRLIRSLSWVSAAIGAIPLPVIPDLFLLVPLQFWMISRLGALYGKDSSKNQLGRFAAVIGWGLVFRIVARSLLKFIPVAGAIACAVVAFSGTRIVGELGMVWYRTDMRMQPAELKAAWGQLRRKLGLFRPKIAAS